MYCTNVDLYEFFNLKKPEGGRGILTVYARKRNEEDPATMLRPAMLVLPGGGYEYVSYREGDPVAMQWLARGYSAFVLNYTVNTCYPTELLEASMAMAYIRINAEELCVDPQHVAAVGFSAGGHLCATLANVDAHTQIAELLPQYKHLLRPTAVILSYAVVSNDNGNTHLRTFEVVTDHGRLPLTLLDPAKAVTPNTAPAFIWHTRMDSVVPVSNSLDYAVACLKNNVRFELHVFDEGDHGLSICTEDTGYVNPCAEHWIELSANWLREVMGFKLKF